MLSALSDAPPEQILLRARLLADVTAIRRDFGWSPVRTLEETLAELLEPQAVGHAG